jgi:sugar O-acyltransferase (sialic acid O-acetyltransferase NeuD family)
MLVALSKGSVKIRGSRRALLSRCLLTCGCVESRAVFVAGTGSFAAEMSDWAGAAGVRVLGLIEMLGDHPIRRVRHGLPVVGLELPQPGAFALLGLGGDRRERWDRLAAHRWAPMTVVHPAASCASDVRLGAGVTIGSLAVVRAASAVDDHAIISRGALIGHHVRVGAFATLNPDVNIGGNATIGRDVFIGMGATVVNGVTVGDRAVIAAGAVVLKDVDAATRVQGVPARAVAARLR